MERPTVLVLTRWGPWRPRADALGVAVSLAELALGPGALERAARCALTDRARQVAPEPGLQPFAPDPAPPVLRVPLGAHLLQLGDDGVRLDGLLVLPDDATSARLLLQPLAASWRREVGAGVPRERRQALTLAALRAGSGLKVSDDSLRRTLHRLRTTLADRYHAATGIPLGPDAVIERVGDGWRLHPQVLVA